MPERKPISPDAFNALGQFPHCDALVLHRKGECEYCDAHPEWQALREVWSINFTGENDPDKAPCPSARYRPAYQVHQWGGNRPTNVAVETQPPTAWEHLNRDDDQ